MIQRIIDFDYDVTLYINGCHTPLWDSVMHFLSAIPVWIPLYLMIAAAMFFPKLYGEKSAIHKTGNIPSWAAGVIGVCAVLICFGLCDQISNLFKNGFQRLRPGHDPLLDGLLHLPDGKGGLYGFVSAHAANTFGLAMLTSLIFKRPKYSFFIFVWASSISFSRIYLAKHFLTDVLCGAIAGIIIAILMYIAWKYIIKLSNGYFPKKQ